MKHLHIISMEFFHFRNTNKKTPLRKKLLWSILTIFILLISCKTSKEQGVTILNPQNAIEREVKLSDLVDELIYIPLDNKVIFPGIMPIQIGNNCIVIGTNEGFLRYDREGIFLNRIGSFGRGPGEYQFTQYFAMDSQGNNVYIYDNYKIITYTTGGKLIREFNLFDLEGHPSQVFYRDGKIYLACKLMYGNAKYNWFIVDTLGNHQSSKLNQIPSFRTSQPGWAGFFQIESELFYWNDFNDTIFLLHENSYAPAMYFGQGDFRKPYSSIASEDLWSYFNPRRFFNTEDYIIFNYLYNHYNHLALIDKKRGNIFTIDKGTSSTRGYEPGIKNDIDGGLDFHPYYSFTDENDYTYLVTWYFAYRLIRYVESESFRNSTPKFPEKKKQLEKLAARLNKNDNQVLVLAKLKE